MFRKRLYIYSTFFVKYLCCYAFIEDFSIYRPTWRTGVKTAKFRIRPSGFSKGDDQNFLMQTKALEKEGIDKIFEEVASGGRWDRPALHKMLEQLREGDTVVVWKLDRLSRSLKDLLVILGLIKQEQDSRALQSLLIQRLLQVE
jgi:resolvase-like protein